MPLPAAVSGFSLRSLVLLAVFMGLVGCASNEPLIPPTPLQDLKPTVQSRKAWSVKVGQSKQHPASYFAPAANKQIVFSASSDGQVIAFNAESGKTVWRRKIDARLSSGQTAKPAGVSVCHQKSSNLSLPDLVAL